VNDLTSIGVGYLAEMLKTNSTLQILDLGSTVLVRLQIIDTKIGQDGFHALAEALKENSGLKIIYLYSFVDNSLIVSRQPCN
jgi:hypothetical protein